MVRARGAGAPSAAGVVVTLGPAALRAGPRGPVCGPWAGQRAASAGRENGQSRGQRKPRRLRAAGLPDPCAKGRTCAGSAAVGRPPWHSVSPRGGIKDSSSWAAQGSEVTGQPPAWLEGGISGSHTHTHSLSLSLSQTALNPNTQMSWRSVMAGSGTVSLAALLCSADTPPIPQDRPPVLCRILSPDDSGAASAEGRGSVQRPSRRARG